MSQKFVTVAITATFDVAFLTRAYLQTQVPFGTNEAPLVPQVCLPHYGRYARWLILANSISCSARVGCWRLDCNSTNQIGEGSSRC